jgi:hypothetical protein
MGGGRETTPDQKCSLGFVDGLIDENLSIYKSAVPNASLGEFSVDPYPISAAVDLSLLAFSDVV